MRQTNIWLLFTKGPVTSLKGVFVYTERTLISSGSCFCLPTHCSPFPVLTVFVHHVRIDVYFVRLLHLFHRFIGITVDVLYVFVIKDTGGHEDLTTPSSSRILPSGTRRKRPSSCSSHSPWWRSCSTSREQCFLLLWMLSNQKNRSRHSISTAGAK